MLNISDEVYLENLGEPVIFSWVERVREFLFERENNKSEKEENPIQRDLENLSLETTTTTRPDNRQQHHHHQQQQQQVEVVKCPEILTGDCIEDRKSVFQVLVQNLAN